MVISQAFCLILFFLFEFYCFICTIRVDELVNLMAHSTLKKKSAGGYPHRDVVPHDDEPLPAGRREGRRYRAVVTGHSTEEPQPIFSLMVFSFHPVSEGRSGVAAVIAVLLLYGSSPADVKSSFSLTRKERKPSFPWSSTSSSTRADYL